MATITDEERAQASEVFYLPRDGEYNDAPRDDAASEEALAWESFKSEMGEALQHAKITVYREPTDADGVPISTAYTYLFECAPDAYSFTQLASRVRDRYGSGIYRFQMRDKGGVLRRNQRVQIEAPKDAARVPETTGSVIGEVSRALDQQQRRFEILLERMAGQQRTRDPMEEMTKMMAAFGGMLSHLGITPGARPAEKTMVERLTEYKMQRELMRDLFGNDSGGDEKIDGFWPAIATVAKSFAGPLAQAIALAQKNGALDANGVIRPQALAHNPAPERREEPDHSEMREKLQFLVTQAENGIDPHDAASFVMQVLPDDDEAVNALYDFLTHPQCLEQCRAILPAVGDHLQWFTTWRKLMTAELDAILFDDAGAGLTGETARAEDTGPLAGVTGENAGQGNAATAAGGGAQHVNGDPGRPGGNENNP